MGPAAARVGRALLTAVSTFVLALVLTLYFLIEGRRTYRWLRAFASQPNRAKRDQTVAESRAIVEAYVAGNLITSVVTMVCTLAALLALQVPTAVLLALIAGLFDFVPQRGGRRHREGEHHRGHNREEEADRSRCSSPVYQMVENYYISPRVYGGRLELSKLAVIIAFVVGAQVGGVVGALLALPFAAAYPVIERIWLRDRLGDEVVAEHRRVERRSA